MELAALIVAVVAVAISVLSAAWSVGWSIWQHKKTTSPQVVVEGAFAILVLAHNVSAFGFTAINEGLVPVTISSAFAEVEGSSQHFVVARFVTQAPGPLARVVPPGETWQGFMQADEFRRAVADLAGDRRPPWRVRVGVGGARRRYYSDWFDLSPR